MQRKIHPNCFELTTVGMTHCYLQRNKLCVSSTHGLRMIKLVTLSVNFMSSTIAQTASETRTKMFRKWDLYCDGNIGWRGHEYTIGNRLDNFLFIKFCVRISIRVSCISKNIPPRWALLTFCLITDSFLVFNRLLAPVAESGCATVLATLPFRSRYLRS